MAEVFAPEDPLDAPDGAPTTDTLTRGTRLGRYELLVPVAVGGMAKVWAARQHGHRGFTKLVAIKTILPNLSQDPAFEAMFLDEARVASNVHHPNVCEIYELGEEGKVLYLAMEWVNGDSLVRVLRASGATLPIDSRIAARIIADAATGVHAAHEVIDDAGRPLSVVHRDVSPHNILMSADGNVKVTDFGVAKALGQLHDATSVGTLKGKINYMAPEQVTGTLIDRRSDVFSLGCVLYEATTGRLPFRSPGENEHQVMYRLMQGQCTPPSAVAPGYPPELEAIVMRALANQPIHRFATAERMRMALEEWVVRTGPIVTAAQVAAAVRGRLGDVIERRREKIRVAMATTGTPDVSTMAPANQSASGVVPSRSMQRAAAELPGAGGAAGGHTPSMAPRPRASSVPGSQSDATTKQYVGAAALGVAVALLVGAAGLVVWRATRPAESVVTQEPPSSVAVAPTPAVPESPAGSVTPVASSPAPSAPMAVPPSTGEPVAKDAVELKIPDGASLLVEGVPLANGVHEVSRPKAGQKVSVTVHASGYDDVVVAVDDSTASPVEVTLKKHHHHTDPVIPANPY